METNPDGSCEAEKLITGGFRKTGSGQTILKLRYFSSCKMFYDGFYLLYLKANSDIRWRQRFYSCIPSPLLSPAAPSSVQMNVASWGRPADAGPC